MALTGTFCEFMSVSKRSNFEVFEVAGHSGNFRASRLNSFRRDSMKRQALDLCFLAIVSKCLIANKKEFHTNLLKESSMFGTVFAMYVTLAAMGKREARIFTVSHCMIA